MQKIAEIISGLEPRKFYFPCKFDDLLLLEHFVKDYSGLFLSTTLQNHGCKEIIYADYTKCTEDDLKQDNLLQISCENLIKGNINEYPAKKCPTKPKDYLTAQSYLNQISNKNINALSKNAESIDDLICLILADEIVSKCQISIPKKIISINGLALELAKKYLTTFMLINLQKNPSKKEN